MNPFVRSATIVIACAVAAASTSAPGASSAGYIHGHADPGAQIIVIRLATGSVMGIVAGADGSYRTSDLEPGRYRIAEKGEYHAPRELTVLAGKGSSVDLSPVPAVSNSP